MVRVVLVYPKQTQITGMRGEWCIFTYTHDDVCPRCQVSIILYKLIIHKTVRRRTVGSHCLTAFLLSLYRNVTITKLR